MSIFPTGGGIRTSFDIYSVLHKKTTMAEKVTERKLVPNQMLARKG